MIKASSAPRQSVGDFLWFCLVAIVRIPLAIRHYPAQIGRQLAEVSLGGGALVVGGGAVGVVFLMSTLTGTEVGLEGHNGLDIIGLAPLVGFVSGYANTRELAPIVVALAFAARIGCGFTSRLGAMRISEEIDALESMSITPDPISRVDPHHRGPRHGDPAVPAGTGRHVCHDDWLSRVSSTSRRHLRPLLHGVRVAEDVLFSAVKVVVLTTMVTLVHCYHGFLATGGPEGVGRATGHAIRTSIIAITWSTSF